MNPATNLVQKDLFLKDVDSVRGPHGFGNAPEVK